MMWLEADPERLLLPIERAQQRYFAEHPVIAEINLIAARLMDVISPMLWAAVIVLSVWAELLPD